MAQGDIYRLEWRTEQAGVVMDNHLHYRQDASTLPTDSTVDLINAFFNALNGLQAYLIPMMGPDAALTCVIAKEVVPEGDPPGELSVRFDASVVGLLAENLPPHSTVVPCMSDFEPDPGQADQRSLFLGGIGESMINGPFVTKAMWDLHEANRIKAFKPFADTGSNGDWTLVIHNRFIDDWKDVHLFVLPLYASVKKSRKAFLCG